MSEIYKSRWLFCYNKRFHQIRNLFSKLKLHNLFHILELIIKNYNIDEDMNIYNIIQTNFNLLYQNYDSYSGEESRGDYAYSELLRIGLDDLKLSVENYLDIGTGSGVIPDIISEKMNIKNVFSIDIDNKEFVFKGKSKFMLYDGEKLPFETEKFEMITSFMVFHHVDENKLEKLLKSIYKSLKKDGVLIIKEHDYEKDLENYIDVEHDIYELIRDQPFIQDHKCKYYSIYEMKEIIEKVGFKFYRSSNNKKINSSPSRAYYAIFIK